MAQSRQLAAIMFTDIVGYTALMGEDEQRAFELLEINLRLQEPLIERFNGCLVKQIGDGILASFTTVSDAVTCASHILVACKKVKNLQMRIGIHQAEIIFQNGDVFGDGVNIAARIQSIAPIDGILVSESVHNNISNKKGFQTKFTGEQLLKNVREPIRLYEIVIEENLLADEAFYEELKTNDLKEYPGVPVKSIAVLPFVNMSNDPEQDYFSDGMSEDIITSLSHLEDLKVAGRTSSFQFKGRNIDLHEVGEKLGVKTVLEGSVRRQGNRLRITAQLINVADGFHLWSQKYDRDMDDIFAIQDEIALTITERLKVILLEKDREKIIKTATNNADAYELYLKGMFYLNRRGSSVKSGLECFNKAIAIDPNYSMAYTGYAQANFLLAFYSFSSGREVMQRTRQALQTSLLLDKSNARTYSVLATYYLGFEWNWMEVQKNYLKAIELDPNIAQTHALYGMIYLGFISGKFDEAEREGRVAIKLEPLSAIEYADLSWTLYAAGKFREALEIAKTGIELDNNSFLSQRLAGLCYIALERYDEAIDTFKHLLKISDRNQHAINSLIWAYCNNGNFKEAHALMDELMERSSKEYVAGTYAGLSAAHLGNINLAIELLQRAVYDYDPVLITLKYSPLIPPPLKEDPRFAEILKKIGFPE